MGRRFELSYHRTLAAFVLTTLAVAVPCGAWFVAGSREIEREADLAEKSVYARAQKTVSDAAKRLATRLEELRTAESQRRFYHYQNLFHDPRGAAEGASVSISPLAQGPADAWIEAHFQVDDAGVLTLPTLNDEFPELGLHSSQSAQCSLLGQLKEVAFFCTLESAEASQPARRLEPDNGLPAAGFARHGGFQSEVLATRAWHQHLRANMLYADLKYSRSAARTGGRGWDGAGAAQDTIEILVGPLAWYTLPVGGASGLVALRPVETPEGLWTQGFVLSRQAVERDLQTAGERLSFAPAPARGETPRGQVTAQVAGTQWAVHADLSTALAASASRRSADRDRFLRLFTLGAVAAGLAGLMVVALVYQSERLAQQRAQFAASAAHELRTPLAGLRLYGEMLADGLGDPSRGREYARRIANEVERLGRVVTNVLSFTRLERRIVALQPTPGDLRAAVSDAVERQRPTLESSGVRLEVELDDVPTVSFDRDAVSHIVQNLLDNAEKYTRETEDRSVRVALGRAGERLELTVADNGTGVPAALRRRLFRPFSRGRHQDTPEGLGLGLVLVRMLARGQGGEVAYRDAPGGGALFTVTFAI